MEFECETSLTGKTPETCQHFSLWFPRAYQIFERMTSFCLFFFTVVLVTSSSEKPILAVSKPFALESLQFLPDAQKDALDVARSEAF
jgi:hypothetical protein